MHYTRHLKVHYCWRAVIKLLMRARWSERLREKKKWGESKREEKGEKKGEVMFLICQW